MKPNEFYLDIPVWRSGCWLVWSVNKEQAEEWLHLKFPEDKTRQVEPLETSDACTYCSCPPIIFLSKWKLDPECIGILTHECVHVATHILEKCGVKEKESCDEALAYLIGYLVESFLSALKKKR
jgi:hypothetical protein